MAHNKDVIHTNEISTLQSIQAYINQYEQWVFENTSFARNLESMLYIAPQILPKKSADPEVITQMSYSIVGLLGLYHDYILYKTSNKETFITTSFDLKITRLVRVPLSLLSQCQVLLEVLATKYNGEHARWKIIVWIETVKSLIKAFLLLKQRHCMLLKRGEYKAIQMPTISPRLAEDGPATVYRGSRTGKVFGQKKIKRSVSYSTEISNHVPHALSFTNPTIHLITNMSRKKECQVLLGELLHIFRPLVYAHLRRNTSRHAWSPVMISLVVELCSLWLSSTTNVKGATPVEQEQLETELYERKMAFLLYFLRDPVFNTFTKPASGKACDIVGYVPLVGRLVRFATTMILDYYHQFHFYHSGS